MIRCWIQENESGGDVGTHAGEKGNEYASYQNTDMGLFDIEDAVNSGNGTGTNDG